MKCLMLVCKQPIYSASWRIILYAMRQQQRITITEFQLIPLTNVLYVWPRTKTTLIQMWSNEARQVDTARSAADCALSRVFVLEPFWFSTRSKQYRYTPFEGDIAQNRRHP